MNLAEHLASDTILHVEVDGMGQTPAWSAGELGVRNNDSIYLTTLPEKIGRFASDGMALVGSLWSTVIANCYDVQGSRVADVTKMHDFDSGSTLTRSVRA